MSKLLGATRMTLKQLRVLRGLTQSQAASRLGVSPDTLRNYEQGKSYPDIPMLKKIEDTYEVSYDNIIFFVE